MIDKRQIWIAGLQKSGTTWMHRLLARNFAILTRSDAKHHMPDAQAIRENPDRIWLVIKKNQETWLESIRRNNQGLGNMYPETFDGEKMNEWGCRSRHDKFYDAWGAFAQDNISYVAYEYAMGDTLGFLAEFRDKYDLTMRRDHLTVADTWPAGTPARERYLKGTMWENGNIPRQS